MPIVSELFTVSFPITIVMVSNFSPSSFSICFDGPQEMQNALKVTNLCPLTEIMVGVVMDGICLVDAGKPMP